jgi:hypothetical protein
VPHPKLSIPTCYREGKLCVPIRFGAITSVRHGGVAGKESVTLTSRL